MSLLADLKKLTVKATLFSTAFSVEYILGKYCKVRNFRENKYPLYIKGTKEYIKTSSFLTEELKDDPWIVIDRKDGNVTLKNLKNPHGYFLMVRELEISSLGTSIAKWLLDKSLE